MIESPYGIRSTIRPLRYISWGALLWILDFRFNGFDVLNDVIGSLLVTVGVCRLTTFPASERYANLMRWVCVVSLLSVPMTLWKQFGVPSWMSIPSTLLSLAQFAAVVAFIVAMRWLCLEFNLVRAAASWWLTTLLFVTLFAGPLGVLYGWMLVSQLFGISWNLNFGLIGVLAVVTTLLVPVVHLFVSTSRMRREAESCGVSDGRRFPVLPTS
jgi:hypothetical protein